MTLSSLSWPVQKLINGNFSNIPVIDRINKQFITFYKNKNSGRTLNWHLPYCSSEISFNLSKFNNKIYDIDVNGVQLLILMLFNQTVLRFNPKLGFTFNKILETLKIEKEELVYNLNLLLSTYHILKEENVILSFISQGTYYLNTQFNNMKHNISFNDFNKEDTGVNYFLIKAEEIREVEERNTEDRKYVIDAYIMKILKHKKSLKQSDLIQGVIDSVKFPCEVFIE